MKFTVRSGFVVHDTKIVKVKQAGKEVKQEQTNTYYEDNPVEFDEATALEHIHKLEPADKDAEKFCASLVLPSAAASAPLDHSAAISALADQLSTLTGLVTQLVAAPVDNQAPAAESSDKKSSDKAGPGDKA